MGPMLRENWYVVVATVLILGPSGMVAVPESPWVRAGLPLGMALGVVWQVVHRRDLADRLAVLAAVSLLGAVAMFMPGLRMSLFHLLAVQGIVVGLVLTEQVIRRRKRGELDAEVIAAESSS